MNAEVEHFPEPCAVGGHGPVWCAECMERWPCASASPAVGTRVLPPTEGREVQP